MAAVSHVRAAGLGLTLALVAATDAAAQANLNPIRPDDTAEAAEQAKEGEFGLFEGSFFAAPIPLSNPTVGSGLILLGGYLFQTDEGSDTSFVGLTAFRTDNGTEGYGAAGKLSFLDGRFKVTLGAIEADVFYDLFVGPSRVPVKQEATGYLADFGYGLTDDVTVGASLKSLDSSIRLEFGSGPLPFPPLDADLDLRILGIYGQYDTTDDDLFPREGIIGRLELEHGEVADSDRDFSTAVGTLNGYLPVGARSTFAWKATLCGSSDGTPFFVQCSLGTTDDFRGYESFRFRGDNLASLQAEFRGRIGEGRFGYTVFGGVGAVGDSFGSLDDQGWQAAAGVGARYTLTRKFPLDLSIDVTRNSEGETIGYLYVGQAF